MLFDNWLKVGFFAGNLWQRYSLEHSVLKFYTQENYEWKCRWTYNVIEVEITHSDNAEFLAIRTDEGNILLFKIGRDKK